MIEQLPPEILIKLFSKGTHTRLDSSDAYTKTFDVSGAVCPALRRAEMTQPPKCCHRDEYIVDEIRILEAENQRRSIVSLPAGLSASGTVNVQYQPVDMGINEIVSGVIYIRMGMPIDMQMPVGVNPMFIQIRGWL